MKVLPRSHGQQLLARAGYTHEEIASRVGCSRPLAGHWLAGRRKPTERWRAVLTAVFRIPETAWDEPAPKAKPVKAAKASTAIPVAAAPSSSSSSPAPEGEQLSVRLYALHLQTVVRTKLEALGKDPGTMPIEFFKCAASATSTLMLIGKLTGQTLEVNEARIVRLPPFQRIQESLIAALSPFPEAMRAAGEALVKLGSER